MKTKIFLPFALLFLLMGFKQNEPLQNKIIENFSLTNAVDNSTVSLADFEKAKAVVIIFSSPSCAFCKIYDERIVALAKEFEGKEVQFLLINPNNPGVNLEDNLQFMAKRAKEKGYTFPFLIDNKQKVAGILGAYKTPEAFVLKAINGSFVLKYKGAIDDNPQLATEVNATYLKDAINSVISNAPVKIVEKKAVGCMIKK